MSKPILKTFRDPRVDVTRETDRIGGDEEMDHLGEFPKEMTIRSTDVRHNRRDSPVIRLG